MDDGLLRYSYDAWNRLVKVETSEDSGARTIQTAEFDGLGRRIRKVVTNSGDLDGTFKYYYDEWVILETRNGSDQMIQQFVHGTEFIDELIMVRVAEQGDLYVHQDANWNVIGLTDLGGRLVERYVYAPYGQLAVHQTIGYGDRDGDGDVDATDKGTPGTDCTGTVTGSCRILDLDFDGDYDSTDASLFDSLPQGLSRHPGRTHSAVDQPFAHQGLLHDAEIMSYQNRARQYDPGKRRFVQRDPLNIRAQAMRGHGDGTNLYVIATSATNQVDPFGLIHVNTTMQGYDAIIRLRLAFVGTQAQDNWQRAEQEIENSWYLSSAGDNVGETMQRSELLCCHRKARVITRVTPIHSITFPACTQGWISNDSFNACLSHLVTNYGSDIIAMWLDDPSSLLKNSLTRMGRVWTAVWRMGRFLTMPAAHSIHPHPRWSLLCAA